MLNNVNKIIICCKYVLSLLHNLKQNIMKIQELKDNRNEIIETLTALFGEENLKSAMNMLKDAAEYSELFNDDKTVQEAIKDIENGNYFQNRKMKLADYISGLNGNDSRTYAFLNSKK